MRQYEKLNPLAVARMTTPGRYPDGHNLYLQITDTGVKSWLFRYEVAGKDRVMGLGPLHTVGLKEAREKARSARQLLLDGRDPLAERRAAKAALAAKVEIPTFRDAARQFFDTNEKRWTNAKHRAQFLSTLEAYAFPTMGRMKVNEIETPDVLRAIEPIWPTKTETADRVRNRIEKVLQWATTRGYRSGDNPARWTGHLSNILPPRSAIAKTIHFAALPYSEIATFVSNLRQREGVAARALEFLILTAARTGEITGATWDEIDLEARVWTIPGERMKQDKEHRVPLSERAVEILQSLPTEQGNPHCFIGRAGTGLSGMAMPSVLKRMDRSDITVHGFRSCFRDWAAETTAFPNHVVEMALAHAIGNAVEKAYRRGDLFDKRRRLIDAWAGYISSPVSAGGEVVPMRRAT